MNAVWQFFAATLGTPAGIAGFATGVVIVLAWVWFILRAAADAGGPDEPFGGQWE